MVAFPQIGNCCLTFRYMQVQEHYLVSFNVLEEAFHVVVELWNVCRGRLRSDRVFLLYVAHYVT
jgi:hypothetical protein